MEEKCSRTRVHKQNWAVKEQIIHCTRSCTFLNDQHITQLPGAFRKHSTAREGQSRELNGVLKTAFSSDCSWFIPRSNTISDLKTIRTWWCPLCEVFSSALCALGSICHPRSFPSLQEGVSGWELQIAGAPRSFVCPWLRIMIMAIHGIHWARNGAGCWSTAF